MKVFHRIMSGIFGVLLLAATLVAASYIDIGLAAGYFAWIVPGVLAASALYMAVKFLCFAFRKTDGSSAFRR
jgi:hypothetical protein